jgi:hypothetical protein
MPVTTVHYVVISARCSGSYEATQNDAADRATSVITKSGYDVCSFFYTLWRDHWQTPGAKTPTLAVMRDTVP